MIQIERLTYHYPHATEPALSDISLQISQGEFVLMSGVSGSGKSTLLRCLNGLTPHFSGGLVAGKVVVGGVDVVAAGPEAMSRRVGFVFQSPDNYALLDQVEAEISFGLEQAGIPPAEMRLRVEEALDLLELAPLRHRSLETLSGGERQRVAIAAALALRPQYLALDEPTSQLDPYSAQEVLEALIRLNQELGLTVVLAEQRLERVLRYADRLIVLSEGRLILDGPPAETITASPLRPPLAQLAGWLGWRPVPLTIKEGQRMAQATLAQFDRRPTPGRATATSEGGKPLLEASHLVYHYGRTAALQDVSLTVGRGETVAVMGRNGSGKSTLLRCLVGQLRPGRGEVRLDGRSIAGQSVAQICRQVAYLPQNPDDLLFAESVLDELGTTWANHGLNQAAFPLTAPALLAQLGLTAVAGAYPRDLSTGQRQRVALGAVMVTTPPLLLLDEPTRGLDYLAKQQLITLWRQWQAAGLGLLIVTHDVELAARIADRVIVLSQGEIIAQGPASDVLAASPHFAPQMTRLFPGQGWLTVEDVMAGLGQAQPDAGG
jgi:energy-coupling factor transport system ATP-binding protein